MKGMRARCRLRFWGVIRAAALILLVQCVLACLVLRTVHARAAEALQSMASELMQIAMADHTSQTRRLIINGYTVHLRTATTTQDVSAVLDQFHQKCRRRSGIIGAELAARKLRESLPALNESTPLDTVTRLETESFGTVACIDTGGALSLSDLVARLRQFVAKKDLHALGDLRYVMARRGHEKTMVLSLWTEGPLRLDRMFPETGDAPGRDPEGLPRPKGLRRLVFAAEQGQPYALTVYDTKSRPFRQLSEFYQQRVVQLGWHVVEVPKDRLRGASRRLDLVLTRSDKTRLVRLSEDAEGLVRLAVLTLS